MLVQHLRVLLTMFSILALLGATTLFTTNASTIENDEEDDAPPWGVSPSSELGAKVRGGGGGRRALLSSGRTSRVEIPSFMSRSTRATSSSDERSLSLSKAGAERLVPLLDAGEGEDEGDPLNDGVEGRRRRRRKREEREEKKKKEKKKKERKRKREWEKSKNCLTCNDKEQKELDEKD